MPETASLTICSAFDSRVYVMARPTWSDRHCKNVISLSDKSHTFHYRAVLHGYAWGRCEYIEESYFNSLDM